MERKAWQIWKHLDATKQGFCFDELGIIWDIQKCKDIIDRANNEAIDRSVKEANELYYQHHIK